MSELSFETLQFRELGKEVEVSLVRNFAFRAPKEEFDQLGITHIDKHTLTFSAPQKRAGRKFNQFLAQHLPELKTKITGNPATYVHANSGIPLLGSNMFGLVYRNTTIIEVKPQTSCNLNCTYCSVGEGLSSTQNDFIVERSYLVDEFIKLAQFIDQPIEAHIGIQGEPFFYAELIDLIADLHAMDNVYKISMDTNGTLLSEAIIDRLSAFSKVRLNISLNTMDPVLAQKLAGTHYNLGRLLEIIRYCCNKVDFLIAPLYLPGINEDAMPKIVEFAKTLDPQPLVCIQNFMEYKTGRKPVKSITWDAFVEKLRGWEKETGVKLVFDFKKDFVVKPAHKLKKPFMKGDKVVAQIKALGRFKNSRLAVAQGRNILLFSCTEDFGKQVKVEILRDKHNVFFGKVL